MSATDPRDRTVPPARLAGRSTGWWGMAWGLVAVWSMVSTVAFAAVYLRGVASAWPPTGAPLPGLLAPAISSVPLLLSLGPAVLLHTAVRSDSTLRLMAGGAGALALGLAHLVLQAASYGDLGFTARTDAFGSTFFALVGFSHLLVGVGLVMLVVLQLQTWGLGLTRRLAGMAVNVALWWYSAVAAWVVLAAVAYAYPRLWPQL
jgi:cytochrome c oxidase subunit III